MTKCYLCGEEDFAVRPGAVRDARALSVLECRRCGLVTLSSHDHLEDGHYERSGMYGANPPAIDVWLRQTERDDRRRFEMLRPLLLNRRVLDVGCGAAGFLQLARTAAARVAGVEPEARMRDRWAGEIDLHASLAETPGEYDVVCSFHVLEHIADPRRFLRDIAARLAPGGRAVIEVPSADDALLTLYRCRAFEEFTYWSHHLFLFTPATLAEVARQAGFRVAAVQQIQRYPLSNHLHWLSDGKPGGHAQWGFLDTPALTSAYEATLAAVAKCDTLVAHLEWPSTAGSTDGEQAP